MRRHLTILLTGTPAALLEDWRRAWDPVMAAVVPAHVTLVYPEEALLRPPDTPGRGEKPAGVRILDPSKVADLIAETAPFRLRLGEVITLDERHGGVFVAVHDVDGTWAQLRHRLLGPATEGPATAEGPAINQGPSTAEGPATTAGPATSGRQANAEGPATTEGAATSGRPATTEGPGVTSGFPPHATILHPRTSSRGPECWKAHRGMSLNGEFTVSEIVHTTTTGEAFVVERRFPLGQPSRSRLPDEAKDEPAPTRPATGGRRRPGPG
ncbi:hypothetical protein Aph02nite_15340 [Actinoplanes philippinensis]|uniref:2'-5' RNA ligase superfamily protein n=1 Tax=Actinoplanes philippinensis TaxID=35752 RepID=A0A1I1ZEA3_9ACTN|nr:2'-5' RNA ligase family protein [Actinoplanes philippinensis]GIE75584.1 hypothetical protein Aph02nite_15340 [Actinoplanes philippinensis]SFE28853.1 hypothetical protein SAMN05421541_1013 [Actinoplanes philippinensis]